MLEGREFKIFSDHKSLFFAFKQKKWKSFFHTFFAFKQNNGKASSTSKYLATYNRYNSHKW